MVLRVEPLRCTWQTRGPGEQPSTAAPQHRPSQPDPQHLCRRLWRGDERPWPPPFSAAFLLHTLQSARRVFRDSRAPARAALEPSPEAAGGHHHPRATSKWRCKEGDQAQPKPCSAAVQMDSQAEPFWLHRETCPQPLLRDPPRPPVGEPSAMPVCRAHACARYGAVQHTGHLSVTSRHPTARLELPLRVG